MKHGHCTVGLSLHGNPRTFRVCQRSFSFPLRGWSLLNVVLLVIVFFPKCPMSKPVVLTVTGCLKMEAVCRMGGTRDESCFVKSCVPGFASVAVGAVAEDEL